MKSSKLIFLTTLAMIAFAANSIFCRLALVDPQNDPLSFTIIRLLSGSLALSFFLFRGKGFKKIIPKLSNLISPLMLFIYALFFSLSYVQIDTGTGALILFACVQLTMMMAAIIKGQKLSIKEKIGISLAFIGFILLLLPGAHVPPLKASLLMAISGMAWGFYSLLGQGKEDPIFLTVKNFILIAPLSLLLLLLFPIELTPKGFVWAVLSGALTSGLGYILWYTILKELVTSTASIIQLSVPALAAFGGVLFLNESISSRLIISSLLILGGILLKVYQRPSIK